MKTFLKKFSQKTIAITGSFFITFLLLSGVLYSVHANSEPYYDIIKNGYGNVFGPGGVNITPKGVTDIDESKAQLSYDISFASIFGIENDTIQKICSDDINETDCINFITKLLVLVPSEAENVKFTLKGTMNKNGENDFGQISTPADVDISITDCNLPKCNESLPSFNEITEKNIDNLNILRKLGADYYPIFKGYTLYSIEGSKDNAHPAMVNVTFEMPKGPIESYVPIRAWLDDTQVSSEYSMRTSYVDHPINFLMPHIGDIKADDFDEHGLYRDSDYCNVTRNLSRWYKMGNDINDGKWSYANSFNLALNPSVSYLGVPHLEDLCDQAAQTIPANPEATSNPYSGTHSEETITQALKKPEFGGNIISNGGVNVSPIGIIAREDDYTRVQYRVDFSGMRTSDESQASGGPYIYIPKYAEDLKFTLHGIIDDTKESYKEYPLPITTPKIQLTEASTADELQVNSYTKSELEGLGADITEARGFVKYHNNSNDHYDLYILGDGMLGSFYVEFNIPKNIDATYIPIRAFLGIRCLFEYCDTPNHRNFNINFLPSNISTTQGDNYLPNIALGDFDKHGLYLNQENCAVTHNSNDWWKIGQDVDNGPWNYISAFSLKLNFSTIYTGVNTAEDFCDQAVVDISIPPVY